MDNALVWRGIIVVIAGFVLRSSPTIFDIPMSEWMGPALILIGLAGIAVGCAKKKP